MQMDLHHEPKCTTIPQGDGRLEKNSDDGQSLGASWSSTVGSVGSQELLTKVRVVMAEEGTASISNPRDYVVILSLGFFSCYKIYYLPHT